MKTRRFAQGLWLALIVLFLVAPSTYAAKKSTPAQPDANPSVVKAAAAKGIRPAQPDPVPSTNLTQDPTTGEDEGGNYTYCIASSSTGQLCRDVVTFYKTGTLCATGCKICAGVEYSASCACKPETLKLTGKCTYW